MERLELQQKLKAAEELAEARKLAIVKLANDAQKVLVHAKIIAAENAQLKEEIKFVHNAHIKTWVAFQEASLIHRLWLALFPGALAEKANDPVL